MFGCEARVGLTTSALPVEVIARMETEEDLLAVTPIRPDSDNDNSLSQTDGVANQIQATSDETPAHDVTDGVLLPDEHDSTSAQDTGDNVTSQPMTAEIVELPTGPSSPTATPSAYDVDSPVSSGQSEEHVASLSPSPSDSPVSSAENHRVAERIKEINRRRREAADAQTSQAERMVKRSRVDLRAGEQGDNVAVPVPLVDHGRG
ncbi:hypothetical protein V1264_013720 [Littorina saxatilis]